MYPSSSSMQTARILGITIRIILQLFAKVMRLVCAIARRLTGLGSLAERPRIPLRCCLLLLVEPPGELEGGGKLVLSNGSQKQLHFFLRCWLEDGCSFVRGVGEERG